MSSDMFIRDTPEKGKDSPAPVQDKQLLNDFFEAYKEYKAYKSLSGPDLRKAEMKKGFFRGFNRLQILFGSNPILIRCLENMREGSEHLS